MAPQVSRQLRWKVSSKDIKTGLDDLARKLEHRLKTKGDYSYASTHEIYGILAEEVKEVLDELQSNNRAAFKKELLDTAVAAIFGYICIDYL